MKAQQPVFCVLVGGGGHARVVLDCLRGQKGIRIYGILDADCAKHGSLLDGILVLGDDGMLPRVMSEGVTHFVLGVGAVGNNLARRRIFENCLRHSLRPLTVVHSSAVCSSFVEISPGCQLFPRSVINPGTRLGVNVIINTGAILEHECVVSDHAHIAPGALLGGAVTVGAEAHVGIGAIIKQGVRIGGRALVGAGAVVVKDVPDGVTVVGIPANPIDD